MNYDQLDQSYWNTQVSRIVEIRGKIASRLQVVAEGYSVPDESDLSIGKARRLHMAVLFIDLCGSSSRPAETLPEQDLLVRAYDLFFGEMVRIAEEYGGEVEKNTGDGLMAYFENNAGTPPEECCKRAVACALTMFHANDELIGPILQATPGLTALGFRVGVDFGPVAISQLGSSKRFTALVAVGHTANAANKMLQFGGPGDLIVGENVANRLPPSWQKWCELHTLETGYVFSSSGAPYRFYKYKGRWTRPL